MYLTAISVEYDQEHDMYIYHTGLAVETDKGYGILLFPRSSNRKTDAYLCNHVGIVDSYIYRGEMMLCFKNRDSLRTLALETRFVEFLNNLKFKDIDRLTLDEAKKSANVAWMDAMRNPMSFAPYKVGERIAQMVVVPYPKVKLTETNQLSITERGEGGFGSTGK
jgi:dUTPase